ncbi:MAG: DUF3108 domain-containing protein [Bacteroidota bacterium]
MKLTSVILNFHFIIFSIVFSLNIIAQEKEPFIYRSVPNPSFNVKERLVFDIRYGFITAGEAIMEIESLTSYKNRQCYFISVKVNSASSFDWVFKVRDRYVSVVDKDGIFPWRFEQHIREGNYKRDFIALFDHPLNTVATSAKKKYPIVPFIHDIVSAFYFTRTVNFSSMKKNDELHLQNFYKDSSYALDVIYLGKEDIEVDAGKFHTIKIRPVVREGGLFKNTDAMTVWLTDDEIKMPVKMSSKIIIGAVVAELTTYSGANGKITAKYK